jgi:hypothetical protein
MFPSPIIPRAGIFTGDAGVITGGAICPVPTGGAALTAVIFILGAASVLPCGISSAFAPQLEQNFPFSGISAPQFTQNIFPLLYTVKKSHLHFF